MTGSKDDLLNGETWVRLISLQNLIVAEKIRSLLRERGIGAVIINDEKFQARSDEDRAKARPDGEGFRLEVPESLVVKAKKVLDEIYEGKDENNGG